MHNRLDISTVTREFEKIKIMLEDAKTPQEAVLGYTIMREIGKSLVDISSQTILGLEERIIYDANQAAEMKLREKEKGKVEVVR